MGWEPRTYSYDAEGNLLGWTQAEPEWTDREREKLLDLATYEAEVCSCGFHESIAQDDPDLIFDAKVCPVCSGVAKSVRIQGARDEVHRKRLGDNPPPAAADPADGRTNILRAPTPAEVAAREVSAAE